jgi:predicted dehydrogenase
MIGRVHIDAVSRLESCRVVGVNARRPGPCRQQASELGVKHYPDLDDVLADSEVDAIVIATPHPSHKEIALRAISAGKHLLVEKPLAVTPSEADEMVGAARRSGVTLGVLFNQRFRPEARKMRELIEEGAVGEIYRTSMTSAMFRTQDYYDRLAWRGTWTDEGGGALLNQGIHAIDMFQWIAGMPDSVYGILSALKHNVEVEDYASAVLEYGNGAHGTLHCDTVQAPNQQRMEVYGEEGALVMDDWNVTLHRLETPVQEFIDSDKSVAFVAPGSQSETFEFEPVDGSGHVPAIDDFSRALLEGREPAITGEDGSRSQELVAAITLSGCRRRKVALPVDRAEYDDLHAELRRTRRLPEV